MKKQSLGIMANNFSRSQLAFYAIHNGNKLVKNPGYDYTCFYSNLSPLCIKPNFSMMQLVEAYSFQGTAVATDYDTLQKLINMPGPNRKFYYAFDLQWLRQQPRPQYESLMMLYRHPEIEVVARSKSHKDIIENNFNLSNVKISEDFDLSVFLCQ